MSQARYQFTEAQKSWLKAEFLADFFSLPTIVKPSGKVNVVKGGKKRFVEDNVFEAFYDKYCTNENRAELLIVSALVSFFCKLG
jgi:hypothetical protein